MIIIKLGGCVNTLGQKYPLILCWSWRNMQIPVEILVT